MNEYEKSNLAVKILRHLITEDVIRKNVQIHRALRRNFVSGRREFSPDQKTALDLYQQTVTYITDGYGPIWMIEKNPDLDIKNLASKSLEILINDFQFVKSLEDRKLASLKQTGIVYAFDEIIGIKECKRLTNISLWIGS